MTIDQRPIDREYETERQLAAQQRHEAKQAQMMERRRREEARIHALHAAARLYQGRYAMDNPSLLMAADRMFEWLMREPEPEPTKIETTEDVLSVMRSYAPGGQQ